MATFSETKRQEKELGEAPGSMLAYMENLSQALQLKELQETNEFLNTKILQQLMAEAERAPDADKVFELRSAEKEREIRERNEILADLTFKINSLCNRYNEDHFGFNELENRYKTLKEGYKSCLRRLIKKLKTTIEKEKVTRKECEKLKEKEETYKAREKELMDKIDKLEQETKESSDKIAELLNEKCLNDSAPSEGDFIKPSSYTADDCLSSWSCRNEVSVAQRAFKYCGKRSSYCMDKALTYRHLRKTRTSITFTDSESVRDEKRQKKMPK